MVQYLYSLIKDIDGAELSAALIAASILLAVAGNKLRLPGGVELRGRADILLNKTGVRFGSDVSRTMLKKKLTQADLDIQPEYFAGLQYGLPLISAAILILPCLAGLIDIYWLVLICIALYLAPGMWLNNRVKNRIEAIKRDIPDFCMLLANALRGADIMLALEEVAYTMRGELAKEINRVIMDIATGDSREAALNKMALRCSIPELTGLVGKIQQAIRYGSPLEPVVKHHAEKIMARRKHETQKVAGELTIKLLFPIIFFILIPLFMLLGFPIGWNMLTALGD
ncbi:MAG: type II secretion system F family protein [Bacillota bacterium]